MSFDYCRAGKYLWIWYAILLSPKNVVIEYFYWQQLKNRHEFHKVCVDPWLLEHRTCPMCKMDILKHYGYVVMEIIIVISIFSQSCPSFNITMWIIHFAVYRKSGKRREYGFRCSNHLRIASWPPQRNRFASGCPCRPSFQSPKITQRDSRHSAPIRRAVNQNWPNGYGKPKRKIYHQAISLLMLFVFPTSWNQCVVSQAAHRPPRPHAVIGPGRDPSPAEITHLPQQPNQVFFDTTSIAGDETIFLITWFSAQRCCRRCCRVWTDSRRDTSGDRVRISRCIRFGHQQQHR